MSNQAPIGIYDPSTQQWWLPDEVDGSDLPLDPLAVEGAVRLDGEGGPRWAVPLKAPGASRVDMPIAQTHRAADARDRLKRLTPTQLEVAELASGGMTYREIAKALGQKPNTTRTHLKNIYKRLEIASRVELAEIFVYGARRASAHRAA